MDPAAAGGGRLQLFRHEPCGNMLEFGYLYGGNFFSEQIRPNFPGAYLTAPPGLDGVDRPPPPPIRGLDQVGGQLLGSIQSAEIKRLSMYSAVGWQAQFVKVAMGAPSRSSAFITVKV